MVTVTDLDGITVEHCVTIKNFTRWVGRKDGSPGDVTDDKVRAIFGLPR